MLTSRQLRQKNVEWILELPIISTVLSKLAGCSSMKYSRQFYFGDCFVFRELECFSAEVVLRFCFKRLMGFFFRKKCWFDVLVHSSIHYFFFFFFFSDISLSLSECTFVYLAIYIDDNDSVSHFFFQFPNRMGRLL